MIKFILRSSDRYRRLLRLIPVPPMKYVLVLYAFTGWPFFWSGFDYAKYAGYLLPLAISIIFFVSNRRPRFNMFVIILAVYLSLVLLSTGLSEYEEIRWKVFTRAILYLFLVTAALAMSSMKWEELVSAANGIMRIFVVVSSLSIIIFVANLAALELPYGKIDLGWGNIHRVYPFGVVTEAGIFEGADGLSVVRVCGWSVEPGVLASYAVLFLILNKFVGRGRSKGLIAAPLHVLGALSFSLFYLLALFLFVFGAFLDSLSRGWKSFIRGSVVLPRWSFVLTGAALLAIASGVYFYITPGNPLYYLVNVRIYHPELGLFAGNSRSEFDERIVQYARSVDLPRLMIGYGAGSNSLNEHARYGSWTSEVYDSGLLSVGVVGVMLVWLLMRFLLSRERSVVANVFYLLPALLSFYQRPEMIGPIVIIFWVIICRYATGQIGDVGAASDGVARSPAHSITS